MLSFIITCFIVSNFSNQVNQNRIVMNLYDYHSNNDDIDTNTGSTALHFTQGTY